MVPTTLLVTCTYFSYFSFLTSFTSYASQLLLLHLLLLTQLLSHQELAWFDLAELEFGLEI